MTAPPKGLVAQCGFSVPRLDGKGELRFEVGDDVPADAMTDKTLKQLRSDGVVVKSGDADAPALAWRQGHTVVDGVETVPVDAELAEEVPS